MESQQAYKNLENKLNSFTGYPLWRATESDGESQLVLPLPASGADLTFGRDLFDQSKDIQNYIASSGLSENISYKVNSDRESDHAYMIISADNISELQTVVSKLDENFQDAIKMMLLNTPPQAVIFNLGNSSDENIIRSWHAGDILQLRRQIGNDKTLSEFIEDSIKVDLINKKTGEGDSEGVYNTFPKQFLDKLAEYIPAVAPYIVEREAELQKIDNLKRAHNIEKRNPLIPDGSSFGIK